MFYIFTNDLLCLCCYKNVMLWHFNVMLKMFVISPLWDFSYFILSYLKITVDDLCADGSIVWDVTPVSFYNNNNIIIIPKLMVPLSQSKLFFLSNVFTSKIISVCITDMEICYACNIVSPWRRCKRRCNSTLQH